MRANTKNTYLVPVILLLLTIWWNERLSYWYLSNTWATHEENGSCDRVLLVADPQLIGYQREKFGWIARWDSDRYLSLGFSYAKSAYLPNAIIFLGDLFDEGLEANSNEFNETYKRFQNIFDIHDSESVIYIAGDNDIGGESEPVSETARNRFRNYFRNNLEHFEAFYNINETYLFSPRNNENLVNAKNSQANILLSHVSYLSGAYKYVDVGMKMDLILSAHDHTTGIYEIQRSGPQAVLFSRVHDGSPIYRKFVGANEPIVELQTPTCSYRMGVPSMGYGTLTVCLQDDRSVLVQYSVYWMPARFPQLLLYAISCAISVIWVICQKRSRAKRYSWLQ